MPHFLHLQIKNPKSTAGFGSRSASRPQQLAYPDELQQHLDLLRCASPFPCPPEAVYSCCHSVSFCVYCPLFSKKSQFRSLFFGQSAFFFIFSFTCIIINWPTPWFRTHRRADQHVSFFENGTWWLFISPSVPCPESGLQTLSLSFPIPVSLYPSIHPSIFPPPIPYSSPPFPDTDLAYSLSPFLSPSIPSTLPTRMSAPLLCLSSSRS